MHINSEDYAPYFHNGLLYLPERTLELLTQAGLDPQIADSAARGLALDDDRVVIGQISHALEQVMGQIAEHSKAYQELNTEEAYFMLTGRTSN